ncbi:bifunctional chorismate mutase/prephenate dehydratase [Alloiococcus sp. CFN-8]|uniref:bifunctional chorismate mutase/prephenate dehydratase n=1 Tax=Alloiococcus sp. CFN-8 TaxID=3416081 RepID=UPI003CF6CE7B
MDLKEIREKINTIDEELVKLFIKRMELSKEVAEYKAEHKLPILNKAREREIISRVCEASPEELEIYTKMLFTTLFEVSRSYQNTLIHNTSSLKASIIRGLEEAPKLFPLKGLVACQGIEGAYSQLACDKLFSIANIMYFKSFEGVFNAVEKGLCPFGILPIENSSYGSVKEVYDLMRHYNFHIVRSIKVNIKHCLMGKSGTKLSDIKEIYSHEQAIGQCSKFLKDRPDIKITVCENTAMAAKLVASSDRNDIAAISSHNCAALYGLSIISKEIQNSDNNYTRFICIAKDLMIYPGADRISLMLSVPHEAGALYSVISKFSSLGLNLTKLESRPIPGSDFEFMFYFDFEASVLRDEVVQLLNELSLESELFVFLGSYSEV